MASKPTWIPTKQIIPLIQAGIEKEPALPDVPLIIDQPVTAEDKPLLEFMARVDGRTPFATTPGRSRRPGGGAAGRIRSDHQRSGIHRHRHAQNMEIRPMTGEGDARTCSACSPTADRARSHQGRASATRRARGNQGRRDRPADLPSRQTHRRTYAIHAWQGASDDPFDVGDDERSDAARSAKPPTRSSRNPLLLRAGLRCNRPSGPR